MGAQMGVVDGMHAGQRKRVGRTLANAEAHPECEVKTQMTPDHTVAQVQGSRQNWSVFMERPKHGRHKKAPVRCPCCRLAALHGAPRTQCRCLCC